MNSRSWRRLGSGLERSMAGLICLDPVAMAHYLALVDSGLGGRDENHLMGGTLRDAEKTASVVPPIGHRSAVRRLA